MGFIAEYASQNDINRFKLDELLNKYQNTTLSYRHHWTIDKERNYWLIPIKQIDNAITLWVFHYKNRNIEIKLYKTEDNWDLLSIEPSTFSNQEIIHALREALKVLEGTQLIYASPKKPSITEEREEKQEEQKRQVTLQKSSKKTLPYLNILTAIITIVIIFFIVNDVSFTEEQIGQPKTLKREPKALKRAFNDNIEKIDSYETLNKFIKDGQKNGYFPKTIITGATPISDDRLQPIDIENYKKIKWDINAKCSNSASDIILGLDNKNHSIKCDGGDTVVILGKGNDWVHDAFGNDIFYAGEGNDTIETSWGNDIFIFEKNWGHDKVTFRAKDRVDKTKIKNYDGSYPWEYTSFIIFGKGIDRSDIQWRGNTLVNNKTGDTIELNSKKINILFSSEADSKITDKNFIPAKKELKKVYFSQLKGQSITIEDSTIYLTNDKFSILDFKDKTVPTLLSEIYLPGPNVTSTTLQGDIAYATQAAQSFSEGAGGWVSIIDISQKTEPKILTTLKFRDNIYRVAVNGKYLYVTDTNFSYPENRKLFIYDISSPQDPKLVSTTKLQDYNRAMAYSNGLLFLSTFNKGIKVFNVTNPYKPKKVAYNFPLDSRVINMKTEGNKVIFVQDKNIVNILRTDNHQKIEKICDIETDKKYNYGSNSSSSMAIKDGILYTADLREGVGVIDIKTCKFKKRISFDNMLVLSVGVMENNLLAMNKKRTVIFDLKNKESEYATLSQDQLQTLLYDAAVDDDANKVKKLCQAGANPNIRGHNHNSPLQISARLGRLKALKALLDSGAKVDGESMILAALREQIEAMKLLEQYGGDIGQKDKSGCSTLHYLAQDGSVEMVKYLISKGVSDKTVCREKETPLTWARYGNNTPVIEYLQSLNKDTYADMIATKNRYKISKEAAKKHIGSKLKACMACHGNDWSISALGKSAIVKNMSKKDIAKALKGYKNSSYGGQMKGLMKGQVARYSYAELDAIAEAIKSQ